MCIIMFSFSKTSTVVNSNFPLPTRLTPSPTARDHLHLSSLLPPPPPPRLLHSTCRFHCMQCWTGTTPLDNTCSTRPSYSRTRHTVRATAHIHYHSICTYVSACISPNTYCTYVLLHDLLRTLHTTNVCRCCMYLYVSVHRYRVWPASGEGTSV